MRSVATGGFGPSALATPANALTAARFLLTPPFIFIIIAKGPSWPAVAIGSFLAASDIVDGWVARRQGATRSGAFLDPLADKFVILGGLGALVARGEFWWLPAVLVAAREVAISAYRTRLGRRGVSVPASGLAKIKTLAQDTAVGFAILPPLAPHHLAVARGVLWVAVLLSWWTGAQYLLEGERLGQSGEGAPPLDEKGAA